MMFKPATKKQSKLRLSLTGPSGSGKTYSALSIAAGLGERVAVIDTEHGSASLYADKFHFDTCNLETFSPDAYVEAIHSAEQAGYEVIVIDSLSHAWMGKDGALEQVDNASRRSGSKNSYFAWRDVTPKHNALVEAMLQSKAHIIATMRAKTEYALETDDKGKVAPRKIGLGPVQRDGMEYEFSVAGDLDLEHGFNITKTRCSALAGKYIRDPGLQLAEVLKTWLNDGAPGELLAEVAKNTEDSTVEGRKGKKGATTKPAQAEKPPAQATKPPTKPAAQASSGAVSARERLRGLIESATTLVQLESLVPEIQKLGDIDREAVRPAYGKRKSELFRHRDVAVPKDPPTQPETKAAEVTTFQKPAAGPSGESAWLLEARAALEQATSREQVTGLNTKGATPDDLAAIGKEITRALTRFPSPAPAKAS